MSDSHPANDLGSLAKLFFKLGVIGFGGPAAHIAMMEDEVVERRKWLSKQDFLDMVGATNLIPGPNSTEMAIHIGHTRGGMAGLAIAGAAFIAPAVTITVALAWLYVRYGTVPQADPILVGIRPVVVAIIFAALWKLSKKALKSAGLVVLGLAIAGAAAIGSNEILCLLAGGLIAMITMTGGNADGAPPDVVDPCGDPDDPSGITGPTDAGGDGNTSAARTMAPAALLIAGGAVVSPSAGLIAATAAVSLLRLGLYFLTVGSVLYGSGYVLFAFLEGGLVRDFGWLTQQQLLDAVAIGQFTPGPVLSTATFIGYLVAGPSGAIVATAGIFLPSFVFVALLARILPWLKSSVWMRAFLDGVNVSAVALMGIVTIKLAMTSFVGWETAALGLAAAVATVGLRINAAFLVIGGAIAGWLIG